MAIVQFLIENAANIHNAWYPKVKSGTVREMAAEMGHIDIVDALLSAGANVNSPTLFHHYFVLADYASLIHPIISD